MKKQIINADKVDKKSIHEKYIKYAEYKNIKNAQIFLPIKLKFQKQFIRNKEINKE